MGRFAMANFSIFILLTVFYSTTLPTSRANSPPYFYPCAYHGNSNPIFEDNEDAILSVSVEGNPSFYVAEKAYQVTVNSSRPFNGILITGLFSSAHLKQNVHPLSFGMSNTGFVQNSEISSGHLCGMLYSDIAPHMPPANEITFTWTAPSVDTGCISFLITGSSGMNILFQNVLAYQLCEEGPAIDALRPDLADLHDNGMILRDDFDSDDSEGLWSNESVGVSFGNDCGEITHGNSAVFCGETLSRSLVSSLINLTMSSVLQFTTGLGMCDSENVSLAVSYRTSARWHTIKRLKVNRFLQVHLVHLPKLAKVDRVSLMFSQDMDTVNAGCWALDNVLITETERIPSNLFEDMDPIDASKWLFMPGANIKSECMSDGNAMVFSSSVNDTGPTYAVSRDLDLSAGAIHSRSPSNLVIRNGKKASSGCGHKNATDSLYIFNGNGVRSVCTASTENLARVSAVHFHLSIGSGECIFSGDSSSHVELFSIIGSSRKSLATFHHDSYQEAREITVHVPYFVQLGGGILCLEQMGEQSSQSNVWAIDSFELLERPRMPDYYMQFSLNTLCSSTYTDTTVRVEYSNNFGSTWHLLQKECLPETCQGRHWKHHAVFKSRYHAGWMRVNIPLPISALTKHTRFRWIQAGPQDSDSSWAIDNIYIGSKVQCPNMCSGHGMCLPDGCKCDAGWSGHTCNETTNPFPKSLATGFSSNESFKYAFESFQGAHIGYECGMIGSGKALVLNGPGRRYVVTKPHDGSQIKYLQFAVLMGRHSNVGSCRPPKMAGDGVLVEYSVDNGLNWYLLTVIPYDVERRVHIISVPLPPRAAVPGLQIGWLQPNDHELGEAVWAIDDVILSSELYKSIYSTAENFEKIYKTSVSFHTGLLTDFCNRTNVLLFTPRAFGSHRTLRYAETQTMEASEGLVLEADINLKCSSAEGFATNEYDPYHELYLEYSKDEGVSWHLVRKELLPGSTEEENFHAASVFRSSEFGEWSTVILPMPRDTWSSNLRLRVVQNDNSNGIWALDNVYMGPACEMHCRNRGRCRNGVCQCDSESEGPSCLPRKQLPYGISSSYNGLHAFKSDGWKIVGATFKTTDDAGCGIMTAKNFLYFNKAGVRKMETPDLDTSYGGRIQFYIRINGKDCEPPTERANGILVQYSNNGGVTWNILNELYYLDYTNPEYVYRDLPSDAQTTQTRFRWWQPRNEGENIDAWSVADVMVGETLPGQDDPSDAVLKSNSRRSTDIQPSNLAEVFIVLSNNGDPSEFCQTKDNSIVFNQLRGDRFASTDDFSLVEGDTVQFEINIGCTSEFSWNSPIRLEFSHDEGYSWDLVKQACYPAGRPESYFVKARGKNDATSAHDCAGAARELDEPSIYYQGDYSEWKRVVIPVTERIASRRVRFRWWQYVPVGTNQSAPSSWSIRSVHIGSSCPDYCSGHGLCEKGLDAESVCSCDSGFSGERCDVQFDPINGFWDHFNEKPNSLWWKTDLGIVGGDGCGNVHDDQSLHFGGDGSRVLETVSLKTRSIRMIQFYLKIGGVSSGDSCSIPQYRDESVVLQYSNDNGITWNLIKELSFDEYSSQGERVIVGIPFSAKSHSTSFRWWQPRREPGQPRSQWSVDDVFIGGPDILLDGFQDDFNSGKLSEEHWYSVRGETIGQFTNSNITTDPHSNALIINSENGFAETWDFNLNSGSFIQFDAVLGCGRRSPAESYLKVEYSEDLGKSWKPVVSSCSSDSLNCDHSFGSSLFAGVFKDWKRHTIALPERITKSTRVRFRWIHNIANRSWAIDNVYVGSGCPWMCNGHGRCWKDGEGIDSCTCDSDFDAAVDCYPSYEPPAELEETFSYPWNGGKFTTVIGGGVDSPSDNLINGGYMEMSFKGIRLLETIPLYTADAKYMQFYASFNDVTQNSELIVQATRNGGITWKTLHVVQSNQLEESRNFIHIDLPPYAQHDAVLFKIWQTSPASVAPAFDDGKDVWMIDNLFIGGRMSSCDSYILEDNFTTSNPMWLHHAHTSSNYFCGSEGMSVIVEPKTGEHSVTTKDLCISENFVLQFKIAVGCSNAGSDEHAVKLEYSTDHGVTWSLLRKNCIGQNPSPKGCTHEYHSPSIYYPGTTKGWRRIIIPLTNLECGSVRFRWNQGHFDDDFDASKAVIWALDDVYIGPSCEQACNGHGECTNEGETCLCDAGYGGPTCCDIVDQNPTYLQESFSNEDNRGEDRARNQFSILSGGRFHKHFLSCNDANEYQWIYKVDREGERIQETRDLDLRDGKELQFYVTFHEVDHGLFFMGNKTEDISSTSVDHLIIQYSTDGGIVWKLLEVLPIVEQRMNEMQYIALDLPEGSRTNATRIRWWHPTNPGQDKHWFALDEIFIGGSSNSIDDHFDKADFSTWVEMSGAHIRPEVGSKCCNYSLSEDFKCNMVEVGAGNLNKRRCDQNFVSTNGVKVSRGSYLSFDLNMNCQAKGGHCEGIELQYSKDLGKSWDLVIPPCYPETTECTQLYQGSVFQSDVYASLENGALGNRIVVPVPGHAWSPSTRFRWLQTSRSPEAWSLDNVYIGNECPGACLGRGKCHERSCICDEGWSGTMCERASGVLRTEIKEVFVPEATQRLPDMFSKVVGGQIDNICGNVGFGHSLRFSQACSRLLQTVRMDTSHADFIQFMFRTGCGGSAPSTRNEGVILDYTTNGGAIWHNLGEMYFKDHTNKPSFINIALPEGAKRVGTQFRWWQPQHSGQNDDDWALDNLFIGGRRQEMILSDDFNVKIVAGPAGLLLDRGKREMWQFYDNAEVDSFCGRDNVILAGKVPGLDVTIQTKDFVPTPGFMMQYTIVVLCDDVQRDHEAVHVQYSIDYGDSWQYLVPQCTPSDRECFGKEITQPSAHFISPDWRRKTIWIPESLQGRPVRFRFYQMESDVVWALDRIFIGPACPDACSGHGDCTGISRNDLFAPGKITYSTTCLCDFGFSGPNCYLSSYGNKKFLKDDFNAGENIGNWLVIEPKNMSIQCGVVYDGKSMSFSGYGPRQSETEDLDLRDATFAQYYAVIGRNISGCEAASSRKEGVLMQYSTDGGITWHVVRELDYQSYLKPIQDYLNIPLAARTNSTRLRWWQPFVIDVETGLAETGLDLASWSLDNIIIGGNEVNEFALSEDFESSSSDFGIENSLDERKYTFYPNGLVGMGQCPGDSTHHMMWAGASSLYPKQSLTTRQLIVMPGHMIQFKIRVGCTEASTCSENFPVRLEFREDPKYYDGWILVKPVCYPTSVYSPYCIPYQYHDSSTYKLEYQNVWKRVTIPLDLISSDIAQFRWIQDDNAPELFSWAIDDIYIGESCPNYCSGHGRCTKTLQCVCDPGFIGEDCGDPLFRYLVPVFRDAFEKSELDTSLWSKMAGGNFTTEGCGPFHSYGFGQNAYFSECGERQLVSREMDLTNAWSIQYVIRFGSNIQNQDCQIYRGEFQDGTVMSTIVLQYTTNNGITWETLREHWPGQYSIPRRVSQSLPTLAKTRKTIFRWWQPNHHGKGYDQWALDNVDISMTRWARHNHFRDYQILLAQSMRQSSQNQPSSNSEILKSARRQSYPRRGSQEMIPPY